MELTFATVAEGPTDHVVLKNILIGSCKSLGLDSGHITPMQPLVDETGKQLDTSHGGWEQVLRWIELKLYRQAFQHNKYVVIQIDTDVCEDPKLGIPKTIGGQARSPEDLVAAISEKLRSTIGPEDLATYSGKFYFAVAVHELECWLLPLWARQEEQDGVHSCKQRVDNALGRENMPGLRKDDVRTYEAASREFRKLKVLRTACEKQKSLKLFCEPLINLSIESVPSVESL